jgi:ADP-heptose:LPS heptosyltransferase
VLFRSERIDNDKLIFPKYTSQPNIRERIKGRLSEIGISNASRLFLLNPGEGVLPLREWPLGSFIALAKKLLEDERNFIIIVGTEGVTKKSNLFLGALNSQRCKSLVGQTALDELLELFLISDALISNDCGLVHLAMLTPIKEFIIFGPESPQVFGPLGKNNCLFYPQWPCSPCLSVLNHRVSSCRENKCLEAIKPDEVFKAINTSLADKK